MPSPTYPKYRVTRWLDTSPAAMEAEQATIFYGIQTKRHAQGPWMHCHRNGEPMLFATPALASAEIKVLRVGDAK